MTPPIIRPIIQIYVSTYIQCLLFLSGLNLKRKASTNLSKIKEYEVSRKSFLSEEEGKTGLKKKVTSSVALCFANVP